MPSRWKRLLAILFAVALIAAACGSDDEPAAEEPATDEPAEEEDDLFGSDALPSGLPEPASLRGVVLTGSPSMLTEDAPWMGELVDWTRAALAAQVPILGPFTFVPVSVVSAPSVTLSL